MRLAPLIVLLASLFLETPCAAASEPLTAEAARPYLTMGTLVDIGGGRRLNLLCMGSGTHSVLFDAGGSDWSVSWALVQPIVAKGARACAYDRAGLGHSDPARGPRSSAAIVEDLHVLIGAARLQRPLVLVGHSLGGFNAKLHAALYPEDIAALVLVDPAEERQWERTRAAMTHRFGRLLAARAELLDDTAIARLVDHYRACGEEAAAKGLDPDSPAYRRCTDPVRPLLGPEIAAERRRIQSTSAYQAAQASEIVNSVYGDERGSDVYRALFTPGAFGRKPMIVLTHGNFDPRDPLDLLGNEQGLALHRETARLSTRGEQRVVPNTNHNIQLEAPEAIAEAIEQVIAQLR